jgi:hypothetical protein
MSLPRNTTPTYQTKVPSTGKTIKYRPWLVGEQKNMLMAVEGGEADVLLAIKEAVNACTFEKLDVEAMPNFDLEYLFLQIRSKSSGETVDLILTCQHCKADHEHNLPLSIVEVQKNKDHTKKIILADNLGVEMAYPTTDQLSFLNKNYSVDTVYQTICQCIESVFTETEVHQTKDETPEEVAQFVEALTTEQFAKIEDFFRTMPVLRHTFTDKCPHCEKETQYTLEGVEAFFG